MLSLLLSLIGVLRTPSLNPYLYLLLSLEPPAAPRSVQARASLGYVAHPL